MHYQPKYSKRRLRKKRRESILLTVLCCAAVALTGAVAGLLLLTALQPHHPDAALRSTRPAATEQPTQLAAQAAVVAAAPETEPAPTELAEPPETKPQILPIFAEMAENNPDMVGWIRVPDTKLDYPVVFTPEDEEKYLHRNLNGHFSVGGVPFISASCSLEPRSDNLIIYGHNMENGTMFRPLLRYEQVNFWREHPVIYLSSLYREEPYQVVAAFYDRVYLQSEDCFKFYQFIDAGSEEDFNTAISYFKKRSLYDTGVTAEYGDELITLVTCAYHVDNGRFVVVAKAGPVPGLATS